MMSDYTPTTEQAKEYFSAGCAHFWEENGEELFDSWLESVKAEAVQEYLNRTEYREVY